MTDNNSNLVFDEEPHGYCKAQVDSYIKSLAKAYQIAYDEHQELQEKFNFLVNEYKKLEYQSPNQLNAHIIASKMLHVEELARQIIEEKQWLDRVIN